MPFELWAPLFPSYIGSYTSWLTISHLLNNNSIISIDCFLLHSLNSLAGPILCSCGRRLQKTWSCTSWVSYLLQVLYNHSNEWVNVFQYNIISYKKLASLQSTDWSVDYLWI